MLNKSFLKCCSSIKAFGDCRTATKMFFPSTSYAGYAKGKYSHALPAGVAFIGLLFLVIGAIIAHRFPGIISDWTKQDVCIISEEHKRFKAWVSDLDRDITVTVHVKNFSDMVSVVQAKDESHMFDWSPKIFTFREHSEKKDVNFVDHRVTFSKYISYDLEPKDNIPDDTVLSVPNLWLIRQYSTLGDPATWLQFTLPQLLLEIISDQSVWTQLITNDCQNSSSSGSLLKECSKFSFVKWENSKNQSIITNSMWPSLKSFLDASVKAVFNEGSEIKSPDACLTELLDASKTSCPTCMNQLDPLSLLLLNHALLQRHGNHKMPWSHLRSCYATHGSLINNDPISDLDFYLVISTIDDYFFNHLRQQLLLELVSRNGLFHSDKVYDMIANKPQNSSDFRLGILPALYGGNGDHLYDWTTCQDTNWRVDADINFQWKALDSKPVEWNSKSEYFVPPPSRVHPCLQPSAPMRIPVMLDGIWKPAMFTYQITSEYHGETVYVYQLNANALPCDDEMDQDDLKINVSEVLGFQALVVPPIANYSTSSVPIATMYIEPVTGAVWKIVTTLELSIIIPHELLNVANLLHLSGVRIPLAKVERTSEVHEDAAAFLRDKLKPMLAIICSGVVVSTSLALVFIALAIGLVVKLHWTPSRERTHVKPEPQDLQMLNTIKLRKMLGN